ncbi:hypothetical protein MTR67_018861 [Solanum verrucosum]|uniref:Uncharacterized protein n=1 Tax=Solanum verrucosum TaxID=315347 RepID=A0AAF0TMS1_SOLVR|nr:hypothetical protein MTR67_018861 [Solanum verrucosum]
MPRRKGDGGDKRASRRVVRRARLTTLNGHFAERPFVANFL